MAESEGFEPSKGALPPYSLSRRAPSTDSASSPCTRLCECVLWRRASGNSTRVAAERKAVGRISARSMEERPGRKGFGTAPHGGGGGIRTLETLRPAGFQDQCIQPLCHPSAGAHAGEYSVQSARLDEHGLHGGFERGRDAF